MEQIAALLLVGVIAVQALALLVEPAVMLTCRLQARRRTPSASPPPTQPVPIRRSRPVPPRATAELLRQYLVYDTRAATIRQANDNGI